VSQYASSAAGGRWRQTRQTVAGLASLDVNVRAFDSYLGQIYYLNVYSPSMGKYRALSVTTSRVGNDICYTVFSNLGDLLDFSHSVSRSGADVIVTVQNNEAFDLEVVMNRLDITT
jgi:hypothetical protein